MTYHDIIKICTLESQAAIFTAHLNVSVDTLFKEPSSTHWTWQAEPPVSDLPPPPPKKKKLKASPTNPSQWLFWGAPFGVAAPQSLEYLAIWPHPIQN